MSKQTIATLTARIEKLEAALAELNRPATETEVANGQFTGTWKECQEFAKQHLKQKPRTIRNGDKFQVVLAH